MIKYALNLFWVKDLTQEEKEKAVEALMFLMEKRDGSIKARQVYNRKPCQWSAACTPNDVLHCSVSAERAVHKLRAVPGDVRIEYRTALSNLQLKYIMS